MSNNSTHIDQETLSNHVKWTLARLRYAMLKKDTDLICKEYPSMRAMLEMNDKIEIMREFGLTDDVFWGGMREPEAKKAFSRMLRHDLINTIDKAIEHNTAKIKAMWQPFFEGLINKGYTVLQVAKSVKNNEEVFQSAGCYKEIVKWLYAKNKEA